MMAVRQPSVTVGDRIALRPGVYFGQAPDGTRCLLSWRDSEPLGVEHPALPGVLRRLAEQPVEEAQLCADFARAGGEPTELGRLLARLRAHGWLTVTVTVGGEPGYTVVPHRRPPDPPVAASEELVLSRFALLRRDGEALVVESPQAWCQLRLHDPALVAAVGALLPGGAPAPPSAGVAALQERLRQDLRRAGLAHPADADEEPELRQRQWSAHELWFHHRTRMGQSGPGLPFGGTWWARGQFAPLPAVPDPAGPAIALPRPDLAALRASDPSLTTVLEERRSIREHDDHAPLSLEQLAEFLYRCARNRRRVTRDGFEYLSRPHPAGGSAYELEIFPVVRLATGLAPGMYHYDAERHGLEQVCEVNSAVRRLLRTAMWVSGQPRAPQVLLVVAARFGRVMFKYEQMPYTLVLKHVGVLYQMMYTVATAMGLAPCGLGGGDATAFAEATGFDPLEQSSVGEFMLGSQPAVGDGDQ